MKIQDCKRLNLSTPTAKLIRLKPSLCELYGGLFFHMIAMVSVLLASFAIVWVDIVFILSLVISLVRFLVHWCSQPVWRLQHRNGQWHFINEDDHSAYFSQSLLIKRWVFWSTHLLILQTESPQGIKVALPIWYDCCSQEDFRWLRVCVKHMMI